MQYTKLLVAPTHCGDWKHRRSRLTLSTSPKFVVAKHIIVFPQRERSSWSTHGSERRAVQFLCPGHDFARTTATSERLLRHKRYGQWVLEIVRHVKASVRGGSGSDDETLPTYQAADDAGEKRVPVDDHSPTSREPL